jgi:hypothetical protein
MRGPRRLLLGAAAAAALASCSAPEPGHDVAYYRAQLDERQTKMAACRSERGKLGGTPNCINALQAASEATSKKFWTVPATPSRVRGAGKL